MNRTGNSRKRAQEKQKQAADKHRRRLDLKENDWVLLKFPKGWLRNTTGKNWQGDAMSHQKYYAKLARSYYGSFQILAKTNETSFRLKLPQHWKIHNAFHVSLLNFFKGQPLVELNEEEEPLEFDEMEE